MSQAQLARRIGISKNAMNDIETGDSDPRASRITAIALELGVSADFLLGLKSDSAAADAHWLQRHGRDDLKESYRQQAHIAAPITSAPPAPPPATRSRTRKAAPVG
jgi:transcriptional regulator with XRE-family HTH domain